MRFSIENKNPKHCAVGLEGVPILLHIKDDGTVFAVESSYPGQKLAITQWIPEDATVHVEQEE